MLPTAVVYYEYIPETPNILKEITSSKEPSPDSVGTEPPVVVSQQLTPDPVKYSSSPSVTAWDGGQEESVLTHTDKIEFQGVSNPVRDAAVVLPSLAEIKKHQQFEPEFAGWWEWFKSNVPPTKGSKFHSWWNNDKDCVYINSDGLLVRNVNVKRLVSSSLCTQVLIPKIFREPYLLFYHNGPEVAHLGEKRAFDKLRQQAFWPSMRSDLHTYVSNCSCKVLKGKQMQHSIEMSH